MIRNELQYFRTVYRHKTSIEHMILRSIMLMALVFFGGLIYFFLPLDIAIKHLFFVLMTMIVLGVAIIAHTHGMSSDLPEQPEQRELIIPEKPTRPPTVVVSPRTTETTNTNRVHEDVSDTPPPKRFGQRRTVFRELVQENGINWLVIHIYTPLPQGVFKKKLWKHKIQRLELDNSRYVNVNLATKIPILPTNDEEKIYCLTRLHWWSHGPAQIGITAATATIITIATIIALNTAKDGSYIGMLIVILLLATGGSIWYFAAWMHWGYRYLVFTNLKIRLMYRPPFNLPSQTPETDLVSLEGGISPSSSWWGNMWGYGSIKTETIATVVDNWLMKEINFVPNYEQVASLLSQIREDAKKHYTTD